MKEIKNWDELDGSSETVEFLNIEKGAYICQIKEVEDVTDKEYLKIKFDVVDGKFKNYFSENYLLQNWPNQGTLYKSYKDTASKFFRAFITAIEKSNANKNYKWNWDERTLVGKYVVVVFGEEEYQDKETLEVKVSVKPVDTRSIQAYKEGKIELPPLKKLKTKIEKQNEPEFEVSDDDLPF